jgi:hypothetical protein
MGGDNSSSSRRRRRLLGGRAKLTSGHNRIWQLLEMAPCLIPFQVWRYENGDVFHALIVMTEPGCFE